MDIDARSVEIIHEEGVHAEWVLRIDNIPERESDPAESAMCFDTMVQIEKLIAERMDEHAAAVVRVVYTLGGRDVHLRDGSSIEFRWQLVVCDWRCLDCGVDTDVIDEYYMLRNPLWELINPDIDGGLCIGCAEKRLGRTLWSSDFTEADVNSSADVPRSRRLANRLQRV